VEGGIEIDDFRIDNVRERLAELGDLWKPMVAKKGRFNLAPLLG
jgi:DNA primase